jgi:penicillin-binding protein 2
MNDTLDPKGKLSLPTILFRVAVLLAFTGLAAQLWRLQIVEGREFRKRAEENHIREVRLPAPRGVIYDRKWLDGQPRMLASNSPIHVLSIIPGEVPKGRQEDLYARLELIIGVPKEQIRARVDKQHNELDLYTPIPIKYNLQRDLALRVLQAHLELPGVVISDESTRRYNEGRLFSHILGYTGLVSPTLLKPDVFKRLTSPEGGYSINDRIGADGLEERYEQLLRGRYGRKKLEVEASGKQRELGVADPARPGSNLVLTLDLDLQRFVDSALREGLHNSPSGVAIVMDPRSGEVLALVSQPGYDNNVFTDEDRDAELTSLLKDPEQPFFNRAVHGLYPPGSTFKLMTGIAALQEGVASRSTVIESRGEIFVENDRYPGARASQRLPEWTPVGLGRLNFIEAIANSSNIYFFILAGGYEKEYPAGPLRLGLGNERLARYARMFGYGAATGIDLNDEADGTMPDEAWKQAKRNEPWYKGDTYNMSIGQGYVQATPLQVANATNTIANGGTLFRPHLLKAVVDADGQVVRTVRPDVIRTVDVDAGNLAVLREAMEAGFSVGSLLPPYRVPGLRIAGKTGTGEFAGEVNAQGELPTHGWFTGYAPADDPKISVTVFVDRGSGSKDAVPIAMRIFRHYYGISEELQAPPLPTPTVFAATPGPTAAVPGGLAGPTARPAATAAIRAPAPNVAPTAAATPTPEPAPTAGSGGQRPGRANRTPGPAQPADQPPAESAPPQPTAAPPPPTPAPAPPTAQPASTARPRQGGAQPNPTPGR